MAEFKNRIKELRMQQGYSQQELADLIGVTKQSISQYERGVRRPDMDTLTALCDVLNVSSDYLTGKSEVTMRFLTTEEMSKLANATAADNYYLDPDARELAEFMHKNPNYKVLFHAARNVPEEDLDTVRKIVEKFGGSD